MANFIDISTILDDSYSTIIKASFFLDGTALTNQTIYDPTLYFNKGSLLKLMRISYELNTFNVRLVWEGAPPKQLLTLASNHHEDINYDWIGGIRNDMILVPTGRIYADFSGQQDGDSGHIILHLKHRD